MQSLNTAGSLRAFLDKNPEKRHDLVAFTQAGDHRIPDWLRGNGPVGFYLLRLRVYLTEHGYRPSEWARINPDVLTCGRAIAHDYVTVEAAISAIGTVKDSFFAVLACNRGLSDERLEKVRAFNKTHGLKLEPLSTPARESSRVPSTKSIVLGERITLDQGAAFQLLASGIALIIPIAEYLASDQCSAEQRNAFRKQVGAKTLFDVTTALNALTSEASRSLMRSRH